MAAEGIGVDGLHCISGTCDLCGEACDANTQELNVLSCTFKNCEDLPYHQDCLEKYLKSIRLERNRKTGFKCPRGCGKGTKHPGPCPGKIDKSHPIHPRNEEQKKKKKAALPQVMAAAPVRVIKTKEEKKAEKEKAKAAAAAAEKAKAAKAAAAPKPSAVASSAAASSSKAKQQQQPDPKKLAEAAAALRREIAANKTNKQLEQAQAQQQQRDASPSQPEYKTLDAYLRESSASSSSAAASAQPVVNAWAKPPAPAAHALSGKQQQQRHRPAEPSRLQAATTARDLSPVSPAAAAAAGSAAARGTAAAGRPAPAATAGSGLPPVPQPPPPPSTPSPAAAAAAAAAAQQGHAGLHHVPSIHSHPLATQGSSASLVSQSSAGANGLLPVGAEYVGEEGTLTKAQRKNLKRAEKKKQKESAVPGTAAASGAAAGAGAGTPGAKLSRLSVVTGGVGGAAAAASAGGASLLSRRASGASDSLLPVGAAAAAAGPSSSSAAAAAAMAAVEPEDEESVALMHELAVHALLANKTLALVASLQRLGFAEWQAAAAVQRHGSELEDAVAWLLEGGAPDPSTAAAAGAGCPADVSIVEELRLMEALGAALPHLPRSQLYVAVADAGGDLDKAAAAAMAAHADILAAAAAAMAAAAATPMGSSSSPLASMSATASPTSTASAQQMQQQQAQAEQLQQQQMMHLQQQQQLPNGLGTVPEAMPFGDSSTLGLYAAPAAPGAGEPGAGADAGLTQQASSSGFGSWFDPSSSTGLGTGLTAHPLHSLASTSSLGVGPLDSAGGSGVFAGYVPGSATAAAAAAMGSNIWGSSSVDPAGTSAGWGQQPGELLSGAGSGSLFAQGGLDAGLGGWGASGLGLLGNQGGVAAANSALNPYAPFGSAGDSSSLFGQGSLAAAAAPQQPAAASTPAAGDAGLQQSRLFSSYGVTPATGGSLFGSAGAAAQGQQQQQAGAGWGLAAAGAGAAAETAASADTDDDLEGMLATLMCH